MKLFLPDLDVVYGQIKPEKRDYFVDYANPLARGLKLYYPLLGDFVNYAPSTPTLTFGSGNAWYAGQYGAEYGNTTNATPGQWQVESDTSWEPGGGTALSAFWFGKIEQALPGNSNCLFGKQSAFTIRGFGAAGWQARVGTTSLNLVMVNDIADYHSGGFTYDGSIIKGYWDGKLVASTSRSGTIPSNTNDLGIGCVNTGADVTKVKTSCFLLSTVVLTDGEMFELCQNPYRLLVPVSPRIYAFLGAAICTKSGSATPKIKVSGSKTKIIQKTGIEKPKIKVSGSKTKTTVKTGTEKPKFKASGTKARTIPKTGIETSKFKALGTKTKTSTKTGIEKPKFRVLGGKVKTAARTGSEVSRFRASGSKVRTIVKAGGIKSKAVISSSKTKTASKLPIVAFKAKASSAKIKTVVTTGAARPKLIASGTKVKTSRKSGGNRLRIKPYGYTSEATLFRTGDFWFKVFPFGTKAKMAIASGKPVAKIFFIANRSKVVVKSGSITLNPFFTAPERHSSTKIGAFVPTFVVSAPSVLTFTDIESGAIAIVPKLTANKRLIVSKTGVFGLSFVSRGAKVFTIFQDLVVDIEDRQVYAIDTSNEKLFFIDASDISLIKASLNDISIEKLSIIDLSDFSLIKTSLNDGERVSFP